MSTHYLRNPKKPDDYGPMVLMQIEKQITEWMQLRATLYLVIPKEQSAVEAAQRICQWHHDHGKSWPHAQVEPASFVNHNHRLHTG